MLYRRLAALLVAVASLTLTGCGGAVGPSGPGVSGTSAASLVDDAYADHGLIGSLGVGRAAYASNSLAYDSSISDTIPLNVGSVSGALDAGGNATSLIDTGLESTPFDSLSWDSGSDLGTSTTLTSLENDIAFDSDDAMGCNGDESDLYGGDMTGIAEIDDALAEDDMAMADASFDDGLDPGLDLADAGTTC